MSTSRSYAIGKGTLRDVPPVYQPYQDESTVDYEGEIQIEPTVVVGGFDVGKLSIAVRTHRKHQPLNDISRRAGLLHPLHQSSELTHIGVRGACALTSHSHGHRAMSLRCRYYT